MKLALALNHHENAFECLRPATLSKKRLWHRCFPVNFAKFLRTPFSQNSSVRLLLAFEDLEEESEILPVGTLLLGLKTIKLVSLKDVPALELEKLEC